MNVKFQLISIDRIYFQEVDSFMHAQLWGKNPFKNMSSYTVSSPSGDKIIYLSKKKFPIKFFLKKKMPKENYQLTSEIAPPLTFHPFNSSCNCTTMLCSLLHSRYSIIKALCNIQYGNNFTIFYNREVPKFACWQTITRDSIRPISGQ